MVFFKGSLREFFIDGRFYQFVVLSIVAMIVIDCSRHLLDRAYTRLTGRHLKLPILPSAESATVLVAMLVEGTLDDLGLTIRFVPGRNMTILRSLVPGTCEAALEAVDGRGFKRGRFAWPCQRDLIVAWYQKAVTGHVDLRALWSIETIRSLVEGLGVLVSIYLLLALLAYIFAPKLSWLIEEGSEEDQKQRLTIDERTEAKEKEVV